MTASPLRTAPAGDEPARVMVCDDSAVIRAATSRILESDPGLRVVARVADGRQALAELARQPIDVVVLDIEMPVMDGLTALPELLRASPALRVIMSSTLTTRGADIAMQALRLGAADYVPKPSTVGTLPEGTGGDAFRRELIEKVKGQARLRQRLMRPAPDAASPSGASPRSAARPAPARSPLLLAVGSSTGGPQALFTFLGGLGTALKLPVLVTQHMPPTFIPLLAAHISRMGGMPCAEARDGEELLPGRIYLAPGDRHLLVIGGPGGLRGKLSADPPENFCRPAVDPMLRSAAEACDGRVVAVMLTGMGHDGLEGTRRVVQAGGCALAQDEATSVVWGMPGSVARAGLCHAVLPLSALAPKVLTLLRGSR